jgi:hypothetical protein
MKKGGRGGVGGGWGAERRGKVVARTFLGKIDNGKLVRIDIWRRMYKEITVQRGGMLYR